MVQSIKAVAGGYEVHVDQISNGKLIPLTLTAPRVIVAAGSIGSTELLLRSRDGRAAELSRGSAAAWSSNGDFLTPAIHPMREVDPTHGPTITAAIDLLDGAYQGQQIFIEDGGLPLPGFDPLKAGAAAGNTNNEFMQRVTASLMPVLSAIDLIRHVMPWFAQSRDAADGVHVDQERQAVPRLGHHGVAADDRRGGIGASEARAAHRRACRSRR